MTACRARSVRRHFVSGGTGAKCGRQPKFGLNDGSSLLRSRQAQAVAPHAGQQGTHRPMMTLAHGRDPGVAAQIPLWSAAVLLLGFSTAPVWSGEAPAGGRAVLPSVVLADSIAERFRSEAGDRVFFAEASAELGSRARVALETQALWLLKHGDVTLVVEGYADDPGDETTNQRLSEQRAENVRQRLVTLGLPPERIISVGYGRGRPAVVCTQAFCAAHNRRVVSYIGDKRSAESGGVPETQPMRTRPSPRRLF